MTRRLIVLVAVLFATLSVPAQAATAPDRTDRTPRQLEGVGIDEHLGRNLPLSLAFRDESGDPVTLGDYFADDVPVIVTLNYSNCPMLCSLELNALVEGMKQLEWSAGEEFRILTVSLDPKESPGVASRTKQRYIKKYDRASAADGWHFLTGKEANIRRLADAIGFRYRYNPDKEEYYHAAAIALISPAGKIMRYLYGIEFAPETLRLGLVESSQGKIGTTVDRLILYCCAYDPKEGSYAMVANRVMTLGGVATLVVLGGLLGMLWLREVRKRHAR